MLARSLQWDFDIPEWNRISGLMVSGFLFRDPGRDSEYSLVRVSGDERTLCPSSMRYTRGSMKSRQSCKDMGRSLQVEFLFHLTQYSCSVRWTEGYLWATAQLLFLAIKPRRIYHRIHLTTSRIHELSHGSLIFCLNWKKKTTKLHSWNVTLSQSRCT